MADAKYYVQSLTDDIESFNRDSLITTTQIMMETEDNFTIFQVRNYLRFHYMYVWMMLNKVVFCNYRDILLRINGASYDKQGIHYVKMSPIRDKTYPKIQPIDSVYYDGIEAVATANPTIHFMGQDYPCKCEYIGFRSYTSLENHQQGTDFLTEDDFASYLAQ